MKRTICLVLCLLLGVVSAGAVAEQSELVTHIQLETETKPLGQVPTYVTLTLSDAEAVKDVKAEDFSIVVEAWRSWNGIPQEAVSIPAGEAVVAVSVADNTMTLTLGKFPERYYLMDAFTVTCSSNDALSFTMAEIDETVHHALEKFQHVKETRDFEGSPMQFNYYYYEPENAEGPAPLVMYIHGFTETWTPFANRWSVVFTEDYVQSITPTYVMVPQFEDDDGQWKRVDSTMVIDESVKTIEKLIAEGKVDPNRIYVVGKSMGGANTYRAIDRYPDFFAGAIICCGGGGDYNGTLPAHLSGLPSWIIFSEADSPWVPIGGRALYKEVKNEGKDFLVKCLEVTAEQVDACFTDSAHHIELLVAESKTYIDWLFAQSREPVSDKIKTVRAHARVTAEGTVIDSLTLLLNEAEAVELSVNGETPLNQSQQTVTLSKLNIPYGAEFEVTGAEGYSFTNEDIRDWYIDTASEFLRYSYDVSNGYDFDYDMFVPQITPGAVVGAREARPIIVVLNDGEDVLLDNRGVVAWAEQTTVDAYVLAPSLKADKAMENTLDKLAYMIEMGLVSDVYVTGTNARSVVNFVNACEAVKAFTTFTLEEMAANEAEVVKSLLVAD